MLVPQKAISTLPSQRSSTPFTVSSQMSTQSKGSKALIVKKSMTTESKVPSRLSTTPFDKAKKQVNST